MARDNVNSIEDLVRARMRRQQFGNTLLILGLVAGVLVLGAIFAMSRVDWRRPSRVPAPPSAKAVPAPPVKPPATVAASAAIASSRSASLPAVAFPSPPPPPAAAATATPAAPATPGPAQPLYKLEAEAPMQPSAPSAAGDRRQRYAAAAQSPDPQRLGTAQSLADYTSGPAAKHMLNSIKCFDDFGFDYESGGRQYFSALCKGGNRKQVSCVGSGCKIEYAVPPSHL